tara:strand:- start:438 stop:1967 length:1530 start_codon:yes stop_codon:yes gene_type:complete
MNEINKELLTEDEIADLSGSMGFLGIEGDFDASKAVSRETVLKLMAAGFIFAASRGRFTPSSMPISSGTGVGLLGTGSWQAGLGIAGPILAGGGLVKMVADWFGDEETMPIDAVIGKAEEETANTDNPFTAADLASDEAVTRKVDAVISAEEIAAGITAEEKIAGQLGNLQFDSDVDSFDPANWGTTNLINDAEFLNVLDLETAAGTITVPWGAMAKGGSPLMSGFAMPATIGFEDIPYFDVFSGGGSPSTEEGTIFEGRAWKVDEERVADGQRFVRKVEEDVPFTVQDAMAIYDAQDPSTRRLIAESLAIGTGTESFMEQILGNQMFTTPSMIYNRESVMMGLMRLGEVAGARAGLLGGGVEAYELLDMIPDVRKGDFQMAEASEESLSNSGMIPKTGLTTGQLTDELFDLATNLGVVKTISQTHSRALATSVYRSLIGRSPDEFALGLFDEWTLEKQKEMMGAGNPTETQLRTHYASKIEAEPELVDERDLFASENILEAFLEALGS